MRSKNGNSKIGRENYGRLQKDIIGYITITQKAKMGPFLPSVVGQNIKRRNLKGPIQPIPAIRCVSI